MPNNIFIKIIMRRKSIKQNSDEFQQNRRYAQQNQDQEGTQGNGKGQKKSNDQYQCGKPQCGKLYHSYTAFYNHCKKSHQGVFPTNSLYNGKYFEGPSKNRGRPRIKKTDVKDSVQIQSLKTQNELIQFLGTLPKKKKNQQLIVYVANPLDQLDNAIDTMEQFRKDNGSFNSFINQIINLNKLVSQNDLPDFYDPIQISNYADKMDSYNFLSVYNFLTKSEKYRNQGYQLAGGVSLMQKILIIWLTRILSVPLLAEVIYTVVQISKGVDKIDEKDYMNGKTNKFKQLIQKYFDCIINEQVSLKTGQSKQEIEQ